MSTSKRFYKQRRNNKELENKNKQFSIDDVVDVDWFPEVYCDWAP